MKLTGLTGSSVLAGPFFAIARACRWRKELAAPAMTLPLRGAIPLGTRAGARALTTTGMLAAVALIDLRLTPGTSLMFFYLVPLALGTWWFGGLIGVLLALVAGAWAAICDAQPGWKLDRSLIWWNGFIRQCVFLCAVTGTSLLRSRACDLRMAVRERTCQLVRETQERQRLQREVVELLTQQREKIALELHDGLAQQLTAVGFGLKALEVRYAAKGMAQHVRPLVEALNGSISLTRTLARGLQPVELEQRTLTAACRAFCREISSAFGVACSFEGCLEDVAMSAESRLHLYRIIQQATDNALRHGRAASVRVLVSCQDSHLRVTVCDDGAGFDPQSAAGKGLGLRSMRYRAESLGGVLQVVSKRGSGTHVHCTIPITRLCDGSPIV